ncbi:RNA exonuclease 4 [Fulvia fulva]|uniref:RNA exonuclease 4 n=1 Tax=Passalora fulva TaxID=5499 RepID=A0A9Q8LGR1_PASFU|nr:RNA exonuclease 4 [Fulvia fulva]UJO16869.1 RNA exonuclease 4 [Fulvia fulva]
MSDRRDVQTASSSYIIRDSAGRPVMHPHAEAFMRGRATQLIPQMHFITRIMAMDAEFQTMDDEESGTSASVIGRISIVNYDGKTIYDVFVYFPEEEGRLMKLPPQSLHLGVTYRDIKPQFGAIPIAEAKEDLRKIIDGNIIVGHSIHNDIDAIKASGIDDILDCAWSFRDTQNHAYYGARLGNNQPGLKNLYKAMVGKSIQGREHSSVEDAQATMELYRLREAEIEREQAGWDFWLEPPRSQDDILDELLNGPDYSNGTPPPKRLPRAFRVAQEQADSAAAAKAYRFKKDDAHRKTPAVAAGSKQPATKEFDTSAAAPSPISIARKDSLMPPDSTTSDGTSEKDCGHSKTSSLARSLHSTAPSTISTNSAHISSVAAMRVPSPSRVNQLPAVAMSAAKRNAAIKIAYPLDPNIHARKNITMGTTSIKQKKADPIVHARKGFTTESTVVKEKKVDPLTTTTAVEASGKSWSQVAVTKDKNGAVDNFARAPAKTVFRKRN